MTVALKNMRLTFSSMKFVLSTDILLYRLCLKGLTIKEIITMEYKKIKRNKPQY